MPTKIKWLNQRHSLSQDGTETAMKYVTFKHMIQMQPLYETDRHFLELGQHCNVHTISSARE